MDEDQVLTAFGALANRTRLRMLRALVRAGGAGLTAGEVGATVEAQPSRASFHLSTMAEAGLVLAERRSRHIVYRVDFQAMGGLLRYLMHDCCGGHGDVRAAFAEGDDA